MKVSNDARMVRQIRTCTRYPRRRRERQGAKLVQSDFEQGLASPWEKRFVLSHARAAAPGKDEALGHGYTGSFTSLPSGEGRPVHRRFPATKCRHARAQAAWSGAARTATK